MKKFFKGVEVTTSESHCSTSSTDIIGPGEVFIFDEDFGSGTCAIVPKSGRKFPSGYSHVVVPLTSLTLAVSPVFKPGDVVTLKSELQPFTVESVNDGIARVVYTRRTFADGVYVVRELLNTDLLKLAEAR